MLTDTVDTILRNEEESSRFQHAVDAIGEHFQARTVTLHRAEEERLFLVASRGIPQQLIAPTKEIPFGKGMAGLCAIRREPVTVCNLQTDRSGVARPAAKEIGVAGAIVLPIFSGASDTIAGTLGVGKEGEYEYSEEETKLLSDCGEIFSRFF